MGGGRQPTRRGLEHPRAVLAVRVVLYLGLAVVLGTLAVGVAGYLLVVAAVGAIGLLVGSDPGVLSLVGLTLGGLVVAGVVGLGATAVVRWAECRVVAADRRPDPVEALAERYVDAEFDEAEFERRLEGVFARREQARLAGGEARREREYERR